MLTLARGGGRRRRRKRITKRTPLVERVYGHASAILLEKGKGVREEGAKRDEGGAYTRDTGRIRGSISKRGKVRKKKRGK